MIFQFLLLSFIPHTNLHILQANQYRMSGMETDAVSKILGSLGSLVKSFSSNLKENVLSQSINETIEEISKQGELEHNQAVSELQQAKVQNLNAYLLVSLYFTHLKLNGDKLNADSNIMSEIKRVKEFMDKVKVAEKRLDQQEEKDTKRAEESEQFMNKHFGNRSSAVSSAHFQAQDEDNKPQGIHDVLMIKKQREKSQVL